jgi:hypothetical protein
MLLFFRVALVPASVIGLWVEMALGWQQLQVLEIEVD